MATTKKNYYAVIKGRKPGIYKQWGGADGAEAQIKGFPGAVYKGFYSLEDAEEWLANTTKEYSSLKQRETKNSQDTTRNDLNNIHDENRVRLYTDGACSGNPGIGGYGAVLLYKNDRVELSEGFRLTTNNRMELMACIKGLEALKTKSVVTIYSDSKYIVDSVNLGWAKKWRANNWKRNNVDYAENPDLWEQLLILCGQHEVSFVWVRGHAGNKENEYCDQLAVKATTRPELSIDSHYEEIKK